MTHSAPLGCPCEARYLERLFHYDARPAVETPFPFTEGRPYSRDVLRCAVCGHCVSHHDWDLTKLYAGEYADAKYTGDALRRRFDRVIALPEHESDNAGRVRRILGFAAARGSAVTPSILDIGAGLCVFLHGMKRAGWHCTALDPDPRAAAHARDCVGVTAVCADFTTAGDLGRFDALTFNKVLEHVADPVSMLAQSRRYLAEGGFVYVEVPDAEQAAAEGAHREEFVVEHHHAFSLASLGMLAVRAGFCVVAIERLQEPSGKYTLRGFLE